MENLSLTAPQEEIAKDTHRFRVVNCGRRFGKTTLAGEEIKAKAVLQASRIVYIAPTYQQARDILWQTLKKELRGAATNINESRLEITTRVVDSKETSTIFLRGWESIETLRGQQFDFVVIDEIAMMRNFWMYWMEVVRPTLTDTKGDGLFISTPKGFNHFYDLFNKEKDDDDFKSFHYSSYDNPHLPREEIDKAKEELTDDRFAQEYMADFRKMEGLVYKEFNRDYHLINLADLPTENKIKDTSKEILCGVDFGYTNPAGVLKIVVDRDDNFYITDEWYKTKQTTDQLIEIVKLFKPNKVYADPAEPDRIEEMKKNGLNCREVSKDIVAGVDRVRELFKQNKIFIDKNCVNLIWELETYQYPEKKPERNEEEKPMKENDHLVDCLRYTLYNYTPMPKRKKRLYTPPNTITGY